MTVNRYETLLIAAQMANTHKRACSKGGDGLVPKEDMEMEFQVWEMHERNLRDLMKLVRFTDGRVMYDKSGL